MVPSWFSLKSNVADDENEVNCQLYYSFLYGHAKLVIVIVVTHCIHRWHAKLMVVIIVIIS